MDQKFRILFELTKFRISLFSSITTSVGYILATRALSFNILVPTFGILLLAFGSATLNHYQERYTDLLMERTKGRPIPSGRISARAVLGLSILFIFLGSAVLYFGTNLTAFLLGLLALFWYNGVYTNLKRVTAFAVVPGSIIGAIPSAVGWTAGGGGLFEPQIWPIMFFFFIWQVPHFWLLLMVFGKQYECAGLPSLTKLFSSEQIKRLIFIWIMATAVACVMMPFFGIVRMTLVNVALYLVTVWLVYQSSKMFRTGADKFSFGYAFREINIYAFLVIVLISIDNLI